MELVFLLQKNAWFLSREGHWYRLDEASVDIALSVFKLAVEDPAELVEQPVHGGTAAVQLQSRGRVLVKFSGPDGKALEPISVKIDRQCLASVKWLTKPWGDGWVPAETTLELENVKSLKLHAFLPGGEGSQSKRLEVHDLATGTVVEHEIPRNRRVVLPVLIRGGQGPQSIRLVCEPELIESSSDSRRLGFLVTEESLRAA